MVMKIWWDDGYKILGRIHGANPMWEPVVTPNTNAHILTRRTALEKGSALIWIYQVLNHLSRDSEKDVFHLLGFCVLSH
jgi:hypothetical protein